MNRNEKLTKEMMENIDSYSNQIKTLEDLIVAVRTRPGMYIGPIGNGGFLNMIREIFQNAIDQLISKDSPCNTIKLFYDVKKLLVRVEDNGLGIPFQDMRRVFMDQHTSKNFNKKPGDYSSGLNGVGAKVTNALSSHFKVESYHYSGKAMLMEMTEGYITKGPVEISNKEGKQGTVIEFTPCLDVLGDIDLPLIVVYKLIKLILSLTDIGTVIQFDAIDKDGKELHEKMVNEDGIITDLIMKTTKPINKPIIISDDTGYMKADIAMVWAGPREKLVDTQGFTAPYSITTFSNWCPTRNEGSTHFAGFIEGVSAWFTKYMNNIFLGEKSKIKVTKNDCLEQLCAMVSVAHLDPQFIGQSKDILSNKDMKPFMKETVMKGLDEWSKENPEDLKRVCKWIKEAASARMKADESKMKIPDNFKKSSITGLPDKYAAAALNINKNYQKYEFELLIVEGDSAGGQAKTARNHDIQAVFPIRGKIKNPMGCSRKEILANQEIQALINILDAGAFENFKPEKVKFSKIIFLTDADPDGSHIAVLLMIVFMVVFPGLIESGKVYKAVPPFFSIKKGKDSTYFTDKMDYIKFKQNIFLSNNDISVPNQNLNNKDFLNIFMQFDEYVYKIETVAKNFALDPIALESILWRYRNTRKIDDTLAMEVKKNNRFVSSEYNKKKNLLTIKGLINDKINNFYFNDTFIEECKDILYDMMSIKFFTFILNGQKVSLYQLLVKFENTNMTGKLNRFKGLGEMEEEDLAESTVKPGRKRILIQYTTDNISEDLETIRTYNSDKSKILNHIGILKRSDIEK